MEQLSTITTSTGRIPTPVLVVVVLAVAALLIVGIMRLRLRHAVVETTDDLLLGEPEQSAADVRRLAVEASDDGRLDDALVLFFRAIALSGVERAVLPRRAGATAHEVADQLAAAFPGDADALRRLAGTFDEVRYGDRAARRAQVQDARELDARLLRERPAHSRGAVL